jgi:hypothetical protein
VSCECVKKEARYGAKQGDDIFRKEIEDRIKIKLILA